MWIKEETQGIETNFNILITMDFISKEIQFQLNQQTKNQNSIIFLSKIITISHGLYSICPKVYSLRF